METVASDRDLHPITQFVRGLEGDLLLIREVAQYLGCSQTALRGAAQRHPELGPSYSVAYGGIRLNLYTPQDMVALGRYLARDEGTGRRRRGQPRLWSFEEAQDRIKRRDCARHRDYQAERESAAGREDLAATSRARAAKLRAGLDAECAIRKELVSRPRRPE